MTRLPYNIFGVEPELYASINSWVSSQMALPPEQRMAPGVYPDVYCTTWRVAGQVAFARLFAEQPYFVVAGCAAFCILPFLLALGLLS